ncbi:uncharacterized mitochondrial protein AtMg00810-like [Vicia villosa]|uniref:uncharacterized mitochondrial protein AtMg00810-like n=1 Tax=Vicia villosa TaxID=3911 RepID=UPI00273CC601|nr:uncharacterized mitochondrial protein AtMg00810-like [Vicia villosa]
MATLMPPTYNLNKEGRNTKVDQNLYLGMIGSLLYLTTSRPVILYSVCFCIRFHSNLREALLIVVKKIFRYLKGTKNLGLLYKKSIDYKLFGFYDVDYVRDKIERKSTSRNCQFIGKNLISWASKRQPTISLSIAQAEHFSDAKCSTQLLWMKYQLEDYQICGSSIPIFRYNTATICLTKIPVQHSKTNHI